MRKEIGMNRPNATLTAGATEERLQPALPMEGTFLKDQHDAARSAMRNTRKLGCAAAALAIALLLLMAGSAAWGAVAVPIVNAGFENPVLADGDYTGYIPGWSVVNGGDIGVWNVQTVDFPTEAPEGANTAYVYGATTVQGFGQVLSGPTGLFQLDSSYSLTVKVGNSASYNGFPGYQVQLLAGGTVIAQDDNTLTVGEGGFVISTVNYTYNSTNSALVGQPLEIRLLSKGVGSDEMEFDDVQLTATSTHPIAVPGGPYTVLIPSGSLSLDGSGSLPSNGWSLSAYDWDLNHNGTFGGVTGATPAAISYATLTNTYGMVPGATPSVGA